MTGHKRHSFIFPLLLIIIGLYLLAYNMGWINLDPWDALKTLWPLFLIAIGLDIILARSRPFVSILVALLFFLFLFFIAGTGHFMKIVTNEPNHTRSRDVAVETRDAEKAKLHLLVNAGELNLKAGPEGGTLLLQGQVETRPDESLKIEDKRTDHMASIDLETVKSEDHSIHLFTRNLHDHSTEWKLEVTRSIPLSLDLGLNAGTGDLDLSELKIDRLGLTVQAGSASLSLPVVEGEVKAAVEGSAGKVTLLIPQTCAARIAVNAAISGVKIDERFPERDGLYISPDYDSATCRWNVDLQANVASVTIR